MINLEYSYKILNQLNKHESTNFPPMKNHRYARVGLLSSNLKNILISNIFMKWIGHERLINTNFYSFVRLKLH